MLYYLSSGRLQQVKNKLENFELFTLKVVAATCEGWSFTRGSKYSDLTGTLLVFWKTGRWEGAVAYERWSQQKVQLYNHCYEFEKVTRTESKVNLEHKLQTKPELKPGLLHYYPACLSLCYFFSQRLTRNNY